MALRDFAQRVVDTIWGSGPHSVGGVGGQLAADMNVYDPLVAKSLVEGMTAGELYETQPHLRTVVSFVARNGAQLGRHVYKRKADDGRDRVRNSPAAQLLAKPNDYMTGFDLFDHLFSELALYDFAMWVPVLRDGRWQVDPIPGAWITGSKGADAFRRAGYWVKYPGTTAATFIPSSEAVIFRGYSPSGFKTGSSAVVSLRSTLAEQVESMRFRQQMWQRGGRVGMFMSRPKDAPEWSPEAKAKFIQMWKSSWAGTGANAGSTPLLEDGMELKRVGFTAKEEQWLEAATLSLATVAGAYHVPPSMVGVQGSTASFASVKEFRKMLYTETLGPAVAQVEDTINQFLLPYIGEPANNYFELNIMEKLQGDFEEQADQLFQAVGGPYMTPNEARKRANMAPIDGGDVLLAPLNMGAAGNNGPEADEPIAQAPSGAAESGTPSETPPKSNGAAHGDRARDGEASARKAPESPALTEDLKDYFDRVRRVTLVRIGSKEPEWWDQKTWNQELSAILLPHLLRESAGAARQAAVGAKLDPDAYSVAQTQNFLTAVADSRADLVNATLRDHYEEALEKGTDPQLVYEDTKSHAGSVAGTILTFLFAWAAVEMAKQLIPDKGPTKTWVASGLPNSRHAAMNGETVPIDEPFSNGAMWPGDPVLGAKGVSNCGCGVDINYDE
ncbi:portal protein [Microbacterium phage FlameThrower]|uniref:portal protein n=1 Tax=Microbacterium phage Katzastrophic TaxID=2912654 RepID=UPI00242DB8A8|nr:portal protein [Microbacterium phage Katzastrophic]UKH48441.1 portal protein [Microbacterium phage Katzastrophic]WNO28719.1 portal protein [Microbacterium phage FlameThrower]